MKLLTCLIILLLGSKSYANTLHIMSLDTFAMEHYKIENNRDPYYPFADSGNTGEYWDSGTAVLFDVDILRYKHYSLYWHNRVHGETTNKQFREVGWEYEAGIDFNDYAETYWYHHSQHLLDRSNTSGFPLQNVYGIRFNFYKRVEHDNN